MFDILISFSVDVPDKIHRAVKRLCVCVSVDVIVSADLELVDGFCYLDNMLSVGGDAGAAVESRV